MRLEQLTFTRFLAAFSIVVFHFGKNIFPFSFDAVDFLFRQANIGVSYFFILSGFVMVIAYGKKEKIQFGDYIKRRFARIYPVYLLAIVVMIIYFLAQGHGEYRGLLLNFALIQSWIPGYALTFNGPGWSLAVEMFFYLSFPFLFNYLYKRYPYKKLIAPFVIIFAISQVVMHVLIYSPYYKGNPSVSHDFIFYFPLMHLSEFLIGNLAGFFFLKGVKRRNYDFLIIVLILLVAFILKSNIGINFHNGMLAFLFIPLIILISANNGFLTKLSNYKPFVFLGEISYGIYILQKPVYMWVLIIMRELNLNNEVLQFYLALIILILFAGFSYKYFETPLRKAINRKRITFHKSCGS